MAPVWSFLAHVMIVFHYAFMAYLVVGGFVAWRWRRTIVLHLAAVTWGVLIVAERWDCPLTVAQNYFRARAGQPRLAHGFITDYLQGVFFPADHQGAAQAVLAVVVLASWVGYVRLGRRRRRAGALASGGAGATDGADAVAIDPDPAPALGRRVTR